MYESNEGSCQSVHLHRLFRVLDSNRNDTYKISCIDSELLLGEISNHKNVKKGYKSCSYSVPECGIFFQLLTSGWSSAVSSTVGICSSGW